jgi:hypothetical protein
MATGLFSSASPEEMQQALLDQRAAASAALTSDQRIGALGYKAGAGVTRGLGQALGVDMQDPMIRRATMARQIATKYPTDTAEGLMAFARDPELVASDPEMASKAMAQAQAMQTQAAALGKTQADTRQATAKAASEEFGTSPAGRAEKLAQTGKYTSKSIAEYVAGSGQLQAIDKFTKPTSDFISKANELGFGDKPQYGDYTAEQTGKVNAALLQESLSGKRAGASKTTIELGQNKFAEELGGGQAKAVLASQVLAQDAANILDTNKTARSLLKAGAITGTGADFFVGLNSGLKQAGIDFGYADAAANSQAYTAALGANVGRIIKQFGAGTGLSDADRAYAEQMAAGKISITRAALEKILDINDKAAKGVITRHNKVASGVNSPLPLTVDLPSEGPPASPSSSEEAAYQAYKRKQGGR